MFPSIKTKMTKANIKAFNPYKGIKPTKRYYARIWHKTHIKHKIYKIKHMKASHHNQRKTPRRSQ